MSPESGPQNQLGRVYRDLQRLNGPTQSLYGPELGPSYKPYGFVASYSCGNPNSGVGGIFDFFLPVIGTPFLLLDCLIQP